MKKEKEVKESMVKEKVKGENELKRNKSEEIRKLYDEGMDLKEISNIVGVRYNMCYNVILNKCLKEGVEMRVTKKREGVKSEVIDLLKEGLSVKEVCMKLGVVYNYVWKLKKEMESK